MENLRAQLSQSRRIVVKVGTRVLVDQTGKPDEKRMTSIVDSIAEIKRKYNAQVVLVTSGAIGAGLQALGLNERPKDVSGLQMCASVGQTRLMAHYSELFTRHGIKTGQVLLTYDDLKHRVRHLNARNTMMRLLGYGVVPVVNENDVVSVDEIKLGDNDVLAAFVAMLVEADLLVLLSTTDGLKKPGPDNLMERVPSVPAVTREVLSYASGKGSNLSTGGMSTKLQAAQMALKAGALVVIADGREERCLERVINGEDLGTIFGRGRKESRLSGRRKWIGFFKKPQGTIMVDEGARKAIVDGGKSLLPVGIVSVDGNFEAGAAVSIQDNSGAVLARGLSAYSSEEISRIKGISSEKIPQILGKEGEYEVVHRDNMVVL